MEPTFQTLRTFSNQEVHMSLFLVSTFTPGHYVAFGWEFLLISSVMARTRNTNGLGAMIRVH